MIVNDKIIRWNEPLGNKECPYAYRWVINLGLFSIRVHKWVASDDKRAMHDHPYWFFTLVLFGSYDDHSEGKVERLTPCCLRFRRAAHKHYVQPVKTPCWTLLVTGPFVRNWGFYPNGKFLRREKYFAQYGHICDQ